MKEYPRWDEVPNHLKTKTQLGKMGLRPAHGQKPVALHWKYNIPDYDLYDIAQAIPKRKPSEAQLLLLSKARQKACTCKQCEKTFSNPTVYEPNPAVTVRLISVGLAIMPTSNLGKP